MRSILIPLFGICLTWLANDSFDFNAVCRGEERKPATGAKDLDAYGGIKLIKSRATGFFRVEKIDGRWWFITPDGHGFLSAGMNHVDYKGDYSPEFVRFVVEHLRDWGFNTIGWSQEIQSRDPDTGVMVHSPGWGPDQYQHARMPYAHLIRFSDMEVYVDAEFPDVYSDAFADKCDRLAKDVCSKLRDDPYLIGYFYADVPNWPLWAEQVGRDKIGDVAQRYYQVIHDAIRRYDPNHLLLGDRIKADLWIPIGASRVRGVLPEVFAAMKPTVDVLCLEYYRPDDEFDDNLRAWHEATGKPIVLADSAWHAPTDVLTPSPTSATYVPDQAARGLAYQQFARRIYANPLIIGWHWCAFGRSTGRKSGVLDGSDQPYEDCVSRMRDFNKGELYQRALAATDAAATATPIEDVGRATLSDAPQVGTSMIDPDRQRDDYGGTLAIHSKATGYFRVEKIGDRWWFITPTGHGFLSMGMNHLDLAALKHADNVHIFEERYGSSNKRYIREGIAEPLQKWGFNTLGWTQEMVSGTWGKPDSVLRHSHEWSYDDFKAAGLPFVYNMVFAEIEAFNNQAHYPDVFGQEFEDWADYLARAYVSQFADEPLLIGYADVPVPDFTSKRSGAWAEHLDLDNESDLARLKDIVRRYFEVVTQAIRRYDPNHLIFGPRFAHPGTTPDWVIEIAGEYFDVILCNNFYTSEEVADGLAGWHKLSGRPLLISDFAFLAPTKVLTVSPTAKSYVADQKSRGEAYQQFATSVIAHPYVLGIHWCAFLENRTRKSGVKTFLDEPYNECVDRMRDFNINRLYSTALGE